MSRAKDKNQPVIHLYVFAYRGGPDYSKRKQVHRFFTADAANAFADGLQRAGGREITYAPECEKTPASKERK